jgi:hypothetical protein
MKTKKDNCLKWEEKNYGATNEAKGGMGGGRGAMGSISKIPA